MTPVMLYQLVMASCKTSICFLGCELKVIESDSCNYAIVSVQPLQFLNIMLKIIIAIK